MLATDENMPYILMCVEAENEIGIDTEATGLNVRNGVDYCIGLGLSGPGFKTYIPVRHKEGNVSMQRWLRPLFDALEYKDLDWHNRKYDWHSIKTLGIDPRILKGKHYDTLLIAHLVDEELPSKELDWLAKRFLGEQKEDYVKDLGKIYGWGNIPPEVMGPYGEHDPYLHWRLKHVLWPKLVEQGLERVYWDTEAELTSALWAMEQRGVGVNKPLCDELLNRGTGRMATIQRELKFNPASPVDLGKYLLDELGLPVVKTTPKGKPSFDKYAMEEYDEYLSVMDNPAAKRINEFRGWSKACSSLYRPMLEKAGPDGRVRTNFKEHGTVTGRLSAEDPNMQQIPRATSKPWNGKAKACFLSGLADFALYGWDYSQIELRMSAAYGPEPLLLEEFSKDKADPFSVLTPRIFGAYSEDLRHATKNKLVYPSLYGASEGKVKLLLGAQVGQEGAAKAYANYKRTIPNIIARSESVNRLMRSQKYITYWDGRRRHIKNPEDARKAWNSLLQGGSAQMVKNAIIRCEKLADNDCFPVLTVHDEITFCIRREAIPDYEPKIIKAMTEWPEPWPVKFAVEGKEWK